MEIKGTTSVGRIFKTTEGALAMSEGQQESLTGIAIVGERTNDIGMQLEGLYRKVSKITETLYGESSDVEASKESEPPYSFSGQFAEVCMRCDRALENIKKIDAELDRFNRS